ncbi:MAG: hydrogenase maturation nickel metallochaperone HypA [bacterium]|nr:MAG: hydrogenase maturation nickel metallochaperone HypA [bacterium]
MKNLLETVERVAADEGADHVDVIHLRIGEMSGVNSDALQFAFEVLSKDTVAEKGRLEIDHVPLMIRCRACGSESHVEGFVFLCPSCQSAEIEIVSGRELEIDYILVDDDECGEEEREGHHGAHYEGR